LPNKPDSDNEQEYDDNILNEDLYSIALMATHNLLCDIQINTALDSNLTSPNTQLSIPADDINDDLDNNLKHLMLVIAAPLAASIRVPNTYKEAMTTPQADRWHNATYAEFDALLAKGVYKVVAVPSSVKVLPSKIVYKAKPTPTSDLAKLKARVVVRGDRQRPSDYDETYSPTARQSSIRILLAICVLLGWVTAQSDVYVAFLNSTLEETLYVMPPPPMKVPPGHAWLLIKSLYRLVQAPRVWYNLLTSELQQIDFCVSAYDLCIYIHNRKALIISVHVDDIRIYAANDQIIVEFRNNLSDKFAITSKDPDALYLGMHIEHTQGTIKIHQAEYVRRLLDRFSFQNLPITKTPCDHRIKLRRNNDESSVTFQKDYLQKFGSLNYLPAMTRVDLAYAASLYGRYNAKPDQTHLDAITRAYAYARGTPDVGITYTKHNPQLLRYCDADWAGCPDTRRSTTGYIFTLAGGPVSWSSTVQKSTALSTCEAEYMALADAAKEGI
jgi:hypothetical protein